MRVQHRVLAATGTAIVILSGATQAQIAGLTARELAGNNLTQFPFFEYVKAINEGATVRFAIDPGTNPGLVGQTVDLYVTTHKTIGGWTANPALVDVSAEPRRTWSWPGRSRPTR